MASKDSKTTSDTPLSLIDKEIEKLKKEVCFNLKANFILFKFKIED